MKKITHVFFDLDHTLWDYETNSINALHELVVHFEFDQQVSSERFIEVYQKVNEKYWRKFNSGKIDREYIKKFRFPEVLKKLNIESKAQTTELNEFFLQNCSTRPTVMPYAHETLAYLKDKYPLAIITNGFPEAQHPKMKSSGLDKYFGDLVISHEVGYRKPDPEIYHLAMERLNAKPGTSVMIGDNPKTDIRGAEKVGMKAIFYNPKGTSRSVTQWQIQSLEELIKIL